MISKKGSIFLFKYVNGEDDFSTLDSLKIEKLNEIENCQIRSQVGDKLHVYYIGQLEDESIFDMRRRQGRNDKVKASIFSFNSYEGKFENVGVLHYSVMITLTTIH